jgi:hypothetical protein
MTTPKLALRDNRARRELAGQQALTATAADDLRNSWALVMLCRRNAVARWRGQPGCSLYEVMRTLDGSLA